MSKSRYQMAYYNLAQKSPVMKNSANTVSASMKSTTRKLAEGNINYLAPITMKSTKQMNADIELDATHTVSSVDLS